MYEYRAKCLRVIDGDTIVADIDLGFHTHLKRHVRFATVNTPEIRTRNQKEKARGIKAKVFVEKVLASHDYCFRLVSKEWQGKYGRVIAEIWTEQGELGRMLVLEGLGKALMEY